MAKLIFFILLVVQHLVASQSFDPCQSLSKSYETLVSKNESTLFRPSEVLACLRTVPVNRTLSAGQIEWFQAYLQFQSTLAYLKDPPAGYELPVVDILGGLQRIKSKITSGGYNSTFYIESDLSSLMKAAYDGHLTVSPLLVGLSAFLGIRNVQLVSISNNGTDLPKVYFFDDLLSTNASDVTSIDGVEITQAIESSAFGFQNLDALYNSVLYNLPGSFLSGSIFYNMSQTFITNDNTTYKFSNGTEKVLSNFIDVTLPLSNITSGQDLYDKLLVPRIQSGTSFNESSGISTSGRKGAAILHKTSSRSEDSSQNSFASPSIVFPLLGYPRPLFSTGDYILAGFFLPNSTDTCVLSSFAFADTLNKTDGVPTGASATFSGLEFQNVTKNFLAACKADGRTKLLIDVRSNIGGLIFYGYDLFKQLFPSRAGYSGTNFRAHPAANILGQVLSSLGPVYVGESNPLWNARSSDFNYLNSLSSPSLAPFSSWQGMYGPVTTHNDTFTNLLAWPLSNITLDLSSSGLVPAGYGNNTDVPSQPFADENITLITDAQCSSTCTVLVNLLLTETNISTIAFGGRPTNDRMAVIGGTEGGEEETFETIQSYAAAAVELLTNSNTSASASQFLNGTKEQALKILRPIASDPPLNLGGGVSAQSLNFRNSIAQGDQSLTPLQFAAPILADCKVFYLRGDVLNVTYTWERVAKGQFVCADGGFLGQKQNGTVGPAPYTKSMASQMDVSLGLVMAIAMTLLAVMH